MLYMFKLSLSLSLCMYIYKQGYGNDLWPVENVLMFSAASIEYLLLFSADYLATASFKYIIFLALPS